MSDLDESDTDVLGDLETYDIPPTEDFKVMNKAEFLCYLDKKVEQVSNEIAQLPDICKTMLRYFDWNHEKMMDRYLNSSNSYNFFALAKLVNPEVMDPVPVFSECKICCEETHLVGFNCYDLFCEQCWKGHIKTKISEGLLSIPCLDPECDFLPSDGFTESMICNDKQSIEIYHELVINFYIAKEKHVKWCPAPNCQFVVKVETVKCQSIRCKCGHYFCFKCSKECHEPVNCRLLEDWIRDYDMALDQTEFSLWSGVYTKECPRCKSSIEKNGGCNHMTCRKPGCLHEFCWLCSKDWHGSHSCNRYEQDMAAADRNSKVEKIRANYGRYKHFYDRYKNHQIELSRNDSGLRNKSEKAYNSLMDARRTLMNTYIFAFYLVDNQERNAIFQHNQEELESQTERLGAILNSEDATEYEIQLQCNLVDSRRMNLLKHCYEGTQNDEWLFSKIDDKEILGMM